MEMKVDCKVQPSEVLARALLTMSTSLDVLFESMKILGFLRICSITYNSNRLRALRYKMGRGHINKNDEFPISLFCHL